MTSNAPNGQPHLPEDGHGATIKFKIAKRLRRASPIAQLRGPVSFQIDGRITEARPILIAAPGING